MNDGIHRGKKRCYFCRIVVRIIGRAEPQGRGTWIAGFGKLDLAHLSEGRQIEDQDILGKYVKKLPVRRHLITGKWAKAVIEILRERKRLRDLPGFQIDHNELYWLYPVFVEIFDGHPHAGVEILSCGIDR